MQSDRTNAILNTLLHLELRSLPQYLVTTGFWADRGDEKALETVDRIVADQRTMAQRIAHLLERRDVPVYVGDFPMAYTDLHFLSLDYLIKRLISEQRRTIAHIERLRPELQHHAEALQVAEETLGSERAHLEMLEELVAQPAS